MVHPVVTFLLWWHVVLRPILQSVAQRRRRFDPTNQIICLKKERKGDGHYATLVYGYGSLSVTVLNDCVVR
jgi:hypothetical protein